MRIQLSRSAPDAPAGTTAYADGAPLDRVQYLEAKLILKPDRFTSVQSFRDFAKIVRRTAKQLGSQALDRQPTNQNLAS